ncbi:hypothetical protein [Bifidobacterium scardovii]|uniref:hypothetical protein n=1 Tax=Bifidobacterium scardovii TaxID=158787 RepID=UPI00291B93CF|nr:hypothetical protein [Bifidobacterium scardovii]MDU8981821.1 hypothetical protein [Bifidobacterium scardovii]
MKTGEFTNEEIAYLRSLPAVSRVTNGRIRYTEDFRRECMRRYAAGESPAKIFHEAGLDSSLIGYKRIEQCISRWRDSSVSATAAADTGEPKDDESARGFSPSLHLRSGKRDLRDLLIAQQVRRIDELEREVAQLHAWIDGRYHGSDDGTVVTGDLSVPSVPTTAIAPRGATASAPVRSVDSTLSDADGRDGSVAPVNAPVDAPVDAPNAPW